MARDEATLLDIVRAGQLILEFKQGLDEVWRTAVVDVPDLLSLIEPLLPEQE